MSIYRNIRGQARVTGTVSGLRDEMPGVVILVRGGDFYCQCPDRIWSPPSFLFSGYRISFSVLKWIWRDVGHSPPSPEVKSEWSYTSSPPICLHVVDKEDRIINYSISVQLEFDVSNLMSQIW